MRKLCLLFTIVMLSVGGLYAISLNESFGSAVFPPAGWKVINSGDGNTWYRLANTQAHTSVCAAIDYSSSAHNDWLISPQLSPTIGDATFRFWAANVSSAYLDRYNIKLSTTTNDQEAFTVTLAANIAPAYNWAQYNYSLSAYAGQTVYVAIQSISTNMGRLLIDDVTGPTKTGFEGFETNNFGSYNWDNSSSGPWTLQSSDVAFGSYMAKSGAIGNSESTSITLTQSGLLAGNISFYHKVSSEAYCDYLKFYIDDVEQGSWSGESGWTLQSYAVTAGTHTFKWTYSKDWLTSSGNDCAWIDEIYLPPVIFGSELNPILIYNFDQLNTVRNFVGSAHSGKHFKLMNDIDASPTITSTWVPIGNNSSMFYGTFDGDNHTISNLRSQFYGPYHGLFGMTAVGSIVKNTVLSSTCYFLGDGDTGSVVGHNKGLVQNCYSYATVNIGNAEGGGGIVGNNQGSIRESRFMGSITRSGSGVTCNKIGGIAGNNETGALIENCLSTGSVTGNTWCGSLVGWNNGTVSRSHANGTVTGAGNTIGGLVGQNNGSINNSYSRANISGASYVGGLVGNNAGTVTNSYSIGTPTATGQKGGLSGANGATINGCYWDTQTSGMATSYGGTGKTTAQMKTQATYTGWDYTLETSNGTNDYWTMWYLDNNGYPELFWKHATEMHEPVGTYPAAVASNLPISGFNITWSPNPVGLTPVSYTLYMVLGDETKLYDTAYAGQHTFTGIAGTSYNPVSTGGITFQFGERWYWSVKAHFASGGVSIPSSHSNFITERDPFATESFEVGNVEYSDNIFEWTQVYGYGYSQWTANRTQTTYNRSPRSGNWNLTMYYATDYYNFGWLFRPYPLVGGVTYDVELYARQNTDWYGNAQIAMHFGTSASPEGMTTEITPPYMVNVTNGDYQRIVASFTPTTSGTYYLGIRNRVAGLIYYMCIDDVTLRPRALPNPVSLVSPANLASGQSLSPTLSWTPATTGGLVTGYKVYCQASTTPITPTTLLATVPSNTYSYTLSTPLTTDTTYYWMVVPFNDMGDAAGCSVRSFNTIATTLLSETFDTFLPANWAGYHTDETDTLVPDNNAWYQWQWQNTESTPPNPSAYLNICYILKRWLVTPSLQLGGAPYQLQLDIALTDWNSSAPITGDPNGTSGIDDKFKILIGDGSSWTTATVLREWNNTGSAYVYNDIPNTGMHVTIPLDAYTGVKYIAFCGESTEPNADNDLFVDNVRVFIPQANDLAALSVSGASSGITGTPVTHSVAVANCGTATQTGFTINLKSVSPAATLATLNVSDPLDGGASATYNLSWTPSTQGVDMTIYAEVELPTDSALTNNTTSGKGFFPHVVGALLESFESGIPANWSVLNPDGNRYSWEQMYISPHSGNISATIIAEPGMQSDDWLITPPLQLSNSTTDAISFWMRSYDVSCPESWEVLISTTNTQPSSFTMIDSGILESSDYSRKEYNLDSYGDAVIYFAVRYRSHSNIALSVDDFHGPLIYIPSELDTPLVIATISGDNVILNWGQVLGATEYHVYASDDPYTWSPDYTIVPVGVLSYSFDTGGVAGKFFKVTAYAGRSNTTPFTLGTKQDNSRLEALKAGLKNKRH